MVLHNRVLNYERSVILYSRYLHVRTANEFPGRYKNFDYDPSDTMVCHQLNLVSWKIAKTHHFVNEAVVKAHARFT